PKRRPSRPRAKAEKKEQEATVEYVPPAYDETEYIHNAQESAADTQAEEEEKSEPEVEEPIEERTEQQREEFIQQSIFDNSPAEEFLDDDDREEQADEQTSRIASDNLPSRNYEYESNDKDEGIGTQPTADPHSIIEEIYASTYTGNRSYSDARAQAYHDEHTDKSDVQSTPIAPPPTPAPAPVAEEKSKTALQPYSEPLPGATREEESAARREYKEILGDLVGRCESRNADNARARTEIAEETATSVAVDSRIEVKRFDEVQKAVAELGNEVTVRSHNDSAKQYTHRYYYYSNRLMMTHYTVMCAVMFLLGLILFLSFYVGAGMRMKYDYILYIFAGLLPIVLFIVAVIIFAGNPDKKKRINVNFRFSIIIRIVVMLQAFVITYCFNLIWGMPVGFSATYIPSLVIPLVYSLFIPISGGIFMTLLKSGHYNVE
ncbi:MAG: hypothetical protein K2M48_04150, partial [Clostridiales bacterium]|nr:hypothetical protein [Clostridiales bacterium]